MARSVIQRSVRSDPCRPSTYTTLLPSRDRSEVVASPTLSVTGSPLPVGSPVAESSGRTQSRCAIFVIVKARRRPSADRANRGSQVSPSVIRSVPRTAIVADSTVSLARLWTPWLSQSTNSVVGEAHTNDAQSPSSGACFSSLTGPPDSGTVYTPWPWPDTTPKTETCLGARRRVQTGLRRVHGAAIRWSRHAAETDAGAGRLDVVCVGLPTTLFVDCDSHGVHSLARLTVDPRTMAVRATERITMGDAWEPRFAQSLTAGVSRSR